MKSQNTVLSAITTPRLCVMQVHVAPAQVWFHCPRCNESLEGFFCDPRGETEVVCDACGTEFDIPKQATLIINKVQP